MSPPPGLLFISCQRYPGFRAWARIVRALRRWRTEPIGGTFPVFQMWRSPTFDFDFAGDIFCKGRVCCCSQRRTDSHPILAAQGWRISAMLQFPFTCTSPGGANEPGPGADRGPRQSRFWLDGKGFWRNKKRAPQGALILNLGVGPNFSASLFSEVQLRGAVVRLL